jgi:hypothetical protein
MALSEEDRLQAESLLSINERKLRIRDKQIERYGASDVPDHIVLDAEDIRRKIVALRAVLEPELPDEISGLVKRRITDDYFIFQQTLGAKQDVAILREDVAFVKQLQNLAATWRMQTDGRLDRIEVQIEASEVARSKGAPFLRRVTIGIAAVSVLALLIAAILAAKVF